MPRFKIEGDPIHVAYGVDEEIGAGVFLSVFDRRLEWNEEANDEVNKVTESIGVKDGGGSYFDLHTGLTGYGIKVSRETMRVFLTRYGVNNMRIDELFRWSYGRPIGSTCSVCYKEDTKTCSKCRKYYYCGKECQVKDWPSHKEVCNRLSSPLEDLVSKETLSSCSVCFKETKNFCAKCNIVSYCSKECQRKEYSIHKLVCDALPFPEKINENHVYAFYLPEDSNKIVLVQVEKVFKEDDDDDNYGYLPNLKPFLGDDSSGCTFMTVNRVNKSRKMENMLLINYRDNFLNDGSKSNRLVKIMTNGQSTHDWRGPILIMKAEGIQINEFQSYMDVELKDFPDVVDFFLFDYFNYF